MKVLPPGSSMSGHIPTIAPFRFGNNFSSANIEALVAALSASETAGVLNFYESIGVTTRIQPDHVKHRESLNQALRQARKDLHEAIHDDPQAFLHDTEYRLDIAKQLLQRLRTVEPIRKINLSYPLENLQRGLLPKIKPGEIDLLHKAIQEVLEAVNVCWQLKIYVLPPDWKTLLPATLEEKEFFIALAEAVAITPETVPFSVSGSSTGADRRLSLYG